MNAENQEYNTTEGPDTTEIDDQAGAERRKTKRYVLTSRNLVTAKITLESGEESPVQHIFINDVNVDGMRITADSTIPRDSKAILVLNLPEPVSLEARIVWNKEIGYENFHMGMEFLVRSQINITGIPQLLRWAYSYYGKTSFRVNAPITFKYESLEDKKAFSPHVIVISPRGIEIKNTFPLPENFDLTFTFTLNPRVPKISARGTVLFQQKLKSLSDEDLMAEFYQIWIEFHDSDTVKNHLVEVRKVDPLMKY